MLSSDWSSAVCSSDLHLIDEAVDHGWRGRQVLALRHRSQVIKQRAGRIEKLARTAQLGAWHDPARSALEALHQFLHDARDIRHNAVDLAPLLRDSHSVVVREIGRQEWRERG